MTILALNNRYFKASPAADYPGGVPTSTLKTDQQWDFPNGWPPLQVNRLID